MWWFINYNIYSTHQWKNDFKWFLIINCFYLNAMTDTQCPQCFSAQECHHKNKYCFSSAFTKGCIKWMSIRTLQRAQILSNITVCKPNNIRIGEKPLDQHKAHVLRILSRIKQLNLQYEAVEMNIEMEMYISYIIRDGKTTI